MNKNFIKTAAAIAVFSIAFLSDAFNSNLSAAADTDVIAEHRKLVSKQLNARRTGMIWGWKSKKGRKLNKKGHTDPDSSLCRKCTTYLASITPEAIAEREEAEIRGLQLELLRQQVARGRRKQ